MKRMYIAAVALVSCAGAVLAADVSKGSGKTAYISSAEIVNSSKQGKEIKAKLDAEFKKSGAEVQAEEQKITKVVNDYKAKESAMNDTAREAEQAKLMKMRREFESMVQEKDEQLKRLQAKLNEELTKEALKTAAEMAQAENLDAVIDVETGRVLYASQNVDYTTKFTERMNKHFDAEKTKAPAKAKA
jgi:Skp family chaperone for outer membrane proteins